MHPELNTTEKMDDARLERARNSIKEMHQVVENLMVDWNNDTEASQTVNERLLMLVREYEEAIAEELMLCEELQQLQDK